MRVTRKLYEKGPSRLTPRGWLRDGFEKLQRALMVENLEKFGYSDYSEYILEPSKATSNFLEDFINPAIQDWYKSADKSSRYTLEDVVYEICENYNYIDETVICDLLDDLDAEVNPPKKNPWADWDEENDSWDDPEDDW